jgi:hypothetical protein
MAIAGHVSQKLRLENAFLGYLEERYGKFSKLYIP